MPRFRTPGRVSRRSSLFELAVAALLLHACATAFDPEQLRPLGEAPFSAERWATADKLQRSAMLYDFFRSHDVTRLTAPQLVQLLGPSTGYYEYDEFPAYLVGPDTVKSEFGRGYLVAFPIDRSTGRVRAVVIEPAVERR